MFSCNNSHDVTFRFLKSNQTHVTFTNSIPDSDVFNILSFEYLYNGGGVGVADFNKDGLLDLFFSGNLVNNALYLNLGKLKFQDISKTSKIEAPKKWCTGVSIVDINNDNWPDIYVSVNSFNTSEETNNLLFIHKGLDKQGIPIFEESAKEYGIQGGKHTMHAAFFDYDLDGDLDLYLLNNILDIQSPTDYRPKQKDGIAPNTDQFYINNGNGTFTDISFQAGIVVEGYGLGISVTDINKDGYPDVYIANDYLTNDLFYINQKDGTFKNEIADRLTKQSKFSMGVASADFDNDTNNDFFVLDMLAHKNYRLKKLNNNSHYNNLVADKKYNYEEQNVRNMLQRNNGDGSFTEMAYYSGVFASDWSWTPLCEDFDLDGDVDIYITNGFPKDITDLDFISYKANRSLAFNRNEILKFIPEVKISNLYFENKGNLKFEDQTKIKGLENPSFSNGAIAADLDNDGDLDIISNNINQESFIIENQTFNNNYLQIKWTEDIALSKAIGAKIFVYSEGKVQYKEYYPHHAYLSSASPILTFGLGESSIVDSIVVIFPNLEKKTLTNIPTNTRQEIDNNSTTNFSYKLDQNIALPYDEIKLEVNNVMYFDANLQSTIPFDYSHNSPMLIESDLGLIACMGLNDYPFIIKEGEAIKFDWFEQLKGITNGIQIDIDGNGEKDLLLTKASYQNKNVSGNNFVILLQKNGKYEINEDFFKSVIGQYSVLKKADFDRDGDEDIFLGSCYKYGQYPDHYQNYLVVNKMKELGKPGLEFKEINHDFAVMDAEWVNLENDGFPDLIVTGHWQGIHLFKNIKGTIELDKSEQPLGIQKGFYNSIVTGDLNNDQIPDLIFGNLGTNTNFGNAPVQMFVKDFDKNGTLDPIVFYHFNGEKTMTPFDLKDEIISQIPSKKKNYTDYESYANADLTNFFDSEELVGAVKYDVDNLKSIAFVSSPSGYQEIDLPIDIQLSPVCMGGMLENSIFLGGNVSFGREFWGKFNASRGSIISYNDGKLISEQRKIPIIKGDLKDFIFKNNEVYISRNGNSIVHFPYNFVN